MGKRETIYLVEADNATREQLGLLFQEHGHDVIGQEGLFIHAVSLGREVAPRTRVAVLGDLSLHDSERSNLQRSLVAKEMKRVAPEVTIFAYTPNPQAVDYADVVFDKLDVDAPRKILEAIAAKEPERTAKEIDPTVPPLEWYVGFGRTDEGLQRVAFSTSLTEAANGEVGKKLHSWTHYGGNHPDIGSKKRIEQARAAIADAEKFIPEHTGFTPQQLWDRRTALEEEYKGKKEAPFVIELY